MRRFKHKKLDNSADIVAAIVDLLQLNMTEFWKLYQVADSSYPLLYKCLNNTLNTKFPDWDLKKTREYFKKCLKHYKEPPKDIKPPPDTTPSLTQATYNELKSKLDSQTQELRNNLLKRKI